MQRLAGRYSLKSPAVSQLDYQIEPQHWKTIEGYKLPVCGPFTQITADRGTAVLYVSQPGEVPLYYSMTPGWIHWHEQALALPGKPIRVEQGSVVIWNPPDRVMNWKFDFLPRPDISETASPAGADLQYRDRLVQAVQRRLGSARRVAVAQSGGLDSLLITWALVQLGVDVVPLTVCTDRNSLDLIGSLSCCRGWGLDVIPIVVKAAELNDLVEEALMCIEETEDSNARMAVGNILMARKCREMGIDLIFSGHGQDDIFGKGTLVKGVLAQQEGTPAERWRDARWRGTMATKGMMKMFASTFRRYGIAVRMPYYDAAFLDWAFSQPIDVLPIEFKKQFVHQVAQTTLPPGAHLDPKHSTGYLSGSGLTLRGKLLEGNPIFREKSLRQTLAKIRQKPLSERIQQVGELCDRTVN